MSAAGKSATEMLSEGDAPVIRHMRETIEALGRTLGDVESVLIRTFPYQAPLGASFESAPVAVYELDFGDAWCERYWHTEREEPLTLQQAKAAIDFSRLSPDDRQFWEGPHL